MVETAAKKYIANTPIILMLNNTNSLNTDKLGPTKAITASVDDALRLGCAGIGFSIHPGSDRAFEMIEDFREIAAEAKSKGLVVALWITPKGGFISRDGESAIDTSAYAAHMASALGAHIINLKTPNKHIEQPKTKKLYKEAGIESQELTGRVRHIVNAAFAGRKIINFCDNFKTEDNILLKDAQEIKQGGANGLCLSYNLFQREKAQAIILGEKITKIFN
jgi:class I fructose-bisphosphate aldolase